MGTRGCAPQNPIPQAAAGKAVAGGSTVRGTAHLRRPRLSRRKAHDAPACPTCAGHEGLCLCCQDKSLSTFRTQSQICALRSPTCARVSARVGAAAGAALHVSLLHATCCRSAWHVCMTYATGGRTIGPYADSLPLSSQFHGGGGWVWGGGGGRRGRGHPDPNIYGLK